MKPDLAQQIAEYHDQWAKTAKYTVDPTYADNDPSQYPETAMDVSATPDSDAAFWIGLKRIIDAYHDDMESKSLVRHVRDPEYWGLPYGTPITPGMNPPGRRPPKFRVTHRRSEPDFSVIPYKEYSIPRVVEQLAKIKPQGLPDASGKYGDPIDCGDDIELAHRLLAEKKSIRLNTPIEVSLLIDVIEREADEARRDGKEPPVYNFCQITIPGVNLFCHDAKDIPRIQMPQFKGRAEPGSYAATTGSDEKVDVTQEFLGLLSYLGIDTYEATMPVTELKATQNELNGETVARLRKRIHQTGDVSNTPIFVTRDGYVLDGHHRWAAEMAVDLEDGHLGDVGVPVQVVDADIGYILDIAKGFSKMVGIKQQSVNDHAPTAEAPVETVPDVPKPTSIDINGEHITQGKDSLWDHLVPDGKGGWQMDRQRQLLHNEIVHRIIDGKPTRENPTFVLIGGGVGSGKTSLQKTTPNVYADNPDETVRIDLDDIKNMIHELDPVPGLSDDERCGFLHEESSYIAEEARIVAQARRCDILLDGTGNSNIKKLTGKVERAQRSGYKVDGVYGTIPTQLAWARNLLRAYMPGSVRGEVAPGPTTGSHQKVTQVVVDGAPDVFDTFRLYDTSGKPPYPLVAESTKDGPLVIHDEKVWEGFLSKPGSWEPDELEAIRSEVPKDYLDQKADLPPKFYDYGWRHPE